MKNLLNQTILFPIVGCLLLFASCGSMKKEVVEFDCGIVETKIAKLNHAIGIYRDSMFSLINSTAYEAAAIKIEIEEISGVPNCFAWTANPQIIASLNITSSSKVISGGLEYLGGNNLNNLFNLRLHNNTQVYSIAEFIEAQTENPLIFFEDAHHIILQLLNQPDTSINQSFTISITFDNDETLNVETSNFEVSI